MPVRFPMIAFACVLFASLLPAVARGEVPSGGAYVTTLPAGADIWIDGAYVGRSPVYVDALAGGRHSITVTKTGWSVQEIDLQVTPGKVTLASTKLEAGARRGGKSNGKLVLRGMPGGAKVILDALPFGGDVLQPIVLPAGTHRVTIETARGTTTRTISIWPDMTTQVVVQPRARPTQH